jgi:TctA family transporter
MVFKKPTLWIMFMGLLSFFYFFMGSRFASSFNIIWWSALLALIVQIPPKAGKRDGLDQKDKNKIVDGMYQEIGIKNGRLKYRIGLFAYTIGGVLGWIIFYGKVVSIN